MDSLENMGTALIMFGIMVGLVAGAAIVGLVWWLL